MVILISIVHVIVCLFLIGVVLLQSGKAADLAGAFGGLGSQTVFGPRGSATVLTRATSISAILFMITSLSLSLVATGDGVGGSSGGGLLDKISAPVQQTGPAETPTGTSAAPATPAPVQTAPAVPVTPAAPVTPAPAPAK